MKVEKYEREKWWGRKRKEEGPWKWGEPVLLMCAKHSKRRWRQEISVGLREFGPKPSAALSIVIGTSPMI